MSQLTRRKSLHVSNPKTKAEFQALRDTWISACLVKGLTIPPKAKREIKLRISKAESKNSKAKLNFSQCALTDDHLALLLRILKDRFVVSKIELAGNMLTVGVLSNVFETLACQLHAMNSIPIKFRLDYTFLGEITFDKALTSKAKLTNGAIVKGITTMTAALLLANTQTHILKKSQELGFNDHHINSTEYIDIPSITKIWKELVYNDEKRLLATFLKEQTLLGRAGQINYARLESALLDCLAVYGSIVAVSDSQREQLNRMLLSMGFENIPDDYVEEAGDSEDTDTDNQLNTFDRSSVSPSSGFTPGSSHKSSALEMSSIQSSPTDDSSQKSKQSLSLHLPMTTGVNLSEDIDIVRSSSPRSILTESDSGDLNTTHTGKIVSALKETFGSIVNYDEPKVMSSDALDREERSDVEISEVSSLDTGFESHFLADNCSPIKTQLEAIEANFLENIYHNAEVETDKVNEILQLQYLPEEVDVVIPDDTSVVVDTVNDLLVSIENSSSVSTHFNVSCPFPTPLLPFDIQEAHLDAAVIQSQSMEIAYNCNLSEVKSGDGQSLISASPQTPRDASYLTSSSPFNLMESPLDDTKEEAEDKTKTIKDSISLKSSQRIRSPARDSSLDSISSTELASQNGGIMKDPATRILTSSSNIVFFDSLSSSKSQSPLLMSDLEPNKSIPNASDAGSPSKSVASPSKISVCDQSIIPASSVPGTSYIDLSYRGLTTAISVCDTMGASIIPTLTSLSLQGNKINDMAIFVVMSSLPKLASLNISSNLLPGKLPSQVMPANLVRLDISSNKLTNISSLLLCTHLEYLDVSNNFIKNLIGLPLKLKHLDLSYNQISTAMNLRILSPCKYLTALYIHGNPAFLSQDYKLMVSNIFPSLEKLDGQALPWHQHNLRKQTTKRESSIDNHINLPPGNKVHATKTNVMIPTVKKRFVVKRVNPKIESNKSSTSVKRKTQLDRDQVRSVSHQQKIAQLEEFRKESELARSHKVVGVKTMSLSEIEKMTERLLSRSKKVETLPLRDITTLANTPRVVKRRSKTNFGLTGTSMTLKSSHPLFDTTTNCDVIDRPVLNSLLDINDEEYLHKEIISDAPDDACNDNDSQPRPQLTYTSRHKSPGKIKRSLLNVSYGSLSEDQVFSAQQEIQEWCSSCDIDVNNAVRIFDISVYIIRSSRWDVDLYNKFQEGYKHIPFIPGIKLSQNIEEAFEILQVSYTSTDNSALTSSFSDKIEIVTSFSTLLQDVRHLLEKFSLSPVKTSLAPLRSAMDILMDTVVGKFVDDSVLIPHGSSYQSLTKADNHASGADSSGAKISLYCNITNDHLSDSPGKHNRKPVATRLSPVIARSPPQSNWERHFGDDSFTGTGIAINNDNESKAPSIQSPASSKHQQQQHQQHDDLNSGNDKVGLMFNYPWDNDDTPGLLSEWEVNRCMENVKKRIASRALVDTLSTSTQSERLGPSINLNSSRDVSNHTKPPVSPYSPVRRSMLGRSQLPGLSPFFEQYPKSSNAIVKVQSPSKFDQAFSDNMAAFNAIIEDRIIDDLQMDIAVKVFGDNKAFESKSTNLASIPITLTKAAEPSIASTNLTTDNLMVINEGWAKPLELMDGAQRNPSFLSMGSLAGSELSIVEDTGDNYRYYPSSDCPSPESRVLNGTDSRNVDSEAISRALLALEVGDEASSSSMILDYGSIYGAELDVPYYELNPTFHAPLPVHHGRHIDELATNQSSTLVSVIKESKTVTQFNEKMRKIVSDIIDTKEIKSNESWEDLHHLKSDEFENVDTADLKRDSASNELPALGNQLHNKTLDNADSKNPSDDKLLVVTAIPVSVIDGNLEQEDNGITREAEAAAEKLLPSAKSIALRERIKQRVNSIRLTKTED